MAEAHPLMLYNTLTRRKEAFQPLDPDNVRMYVCGPTVYDYAHIGNARPVIVFDVLFRLLRHIYGAKHVTYVRNITDVDDKINARAAEEGVSIRDLTERTAKQFHEDIKALGVLPPTVEPRATEHIAEMRTLIEALVANGHAYVAENHVIFDVPSMPDYGRLSNRSLEEMEAGARVEVAPYKKDPMDFVLWKPSKPVGGAVGEKQAEPSWPSPCGIAVEGRPGWHIECSAMAERHLGPVFDIHGGGIDLVFPHHENEIAQSRCAHGTPVMARYWLHNGFLQVEGEKMSKSLGNFITIHDLLKDWPGEVVRFNMLRTHYRQPINWTVAQLKESETELWTWAVRISSREGQSSGYHRAVSRQAPRPSPAVLGALCDDLNTHAAITELRAIYKLAERSDEAASELLENCEFLGLLRHNMLGVHDSTLGGSAPHGSRFRPSAMLHDDVRRLRVSLANGLDAERNRIVELIEAEGLIVKIDEECHVSVSLPEDESQRFRAQVGKLVASRNTARSAKNFKEADRIRDELAAMGIALKDSKDPATGEIVTTWELNGSAVTEASR